METPDGINTIKSRHKKPAAISAGFFMSVHMSLRPVSAVFEAPARKKLRVALGKGTQWVQIRKDACYGRNRALSSGHGYPHKKDITDLKIPALKAIRTLLFAAAGLLFILDIFFASALIIDTLEIQAATEEEIAQYPFGTERGFSYLSKETYIATGNMFSFIFIQSLLFGGFLFKARHYFLSCLVLSSPFVLYAVLIFPTMQ